MYLTSREVFSIKNICEWCVSSAVIMFVLMCLSIWRFLRGDVTYAGEYASAAQPRAGPDPSPSPSDAA
jgi:uncharacterized membrane protein